MMAAEYKFLGGVVPGRLPETCWGPIKEIPENTSCKGCPLNCVFNLWARKTERVTGRL